MSGSLPKKEIPMANSSLISSRLAFHQIDAETCKALREAKPIIIEELSPVLDRFYQHMSGFDEVASMFSGRSHMEKAKQAQIQHWSLIASGEFDDKYAESVTRIGEAHYRLGLEPRLYIAGYSLLISELANRVTQRLLAKGVKRGSLSHFLKLQKAVIKGGMLDIDIAITVTFGKWNLIRW